MEKPKHLETLRPKVRQKGYYCSKAKLSGKMRN
jgi:hypothetical protein